MILLFPVFLAIGLFMLIWPEYFWALTEQWKSNDATEPSTLFIISTRFGGGMLTILGIVGLVVMLYYLNAGPPG